MRIVRFIDARGGPRTGFLSGNRVLEVPGDDGAATLESVLARGDDALAALRASAVSETALDGLTLLPPVTRPEKVLGVGLNYPEHASEHALETPAEPVYFAKLASAIIGPNDDIILPAVAPRRVDYEAELALVIGRGGRDIPVDRAMDHVLGYTAANDVSARDWQTRKPGGQWMLGKSFDTFLPIGPCIVTRDEIPDPADLRITCVIDGETLQDDRASSMLFGIPALIAYVSQVATLAPGDLILTGTPSGTGSARTPPRWLQPDDVVEVTVSGVGTLRNRVRGTGTAR